MSDCSCEIQDGLGLCCKVKYLAAQLEAVTTEKDMLFNDREGAVEMIDTLKAQLEAVTRENEQLSKNVQTWMEESIKWGKKSREDRASLAIAVEALEDVRKRISDYNGGWIAREALEKIRGAK